MENHFVYGLGYRNLKTQQLKKNIKVSYLDFLDGGAEIIKDFFYEVLQGKSYNNALEWCAGHGLIGFYLLSEGICKRISLMDCYEFAIRTCEETISANNLANSVSTFHCDKISRIKTDTKFDLIVGNPPNSFDKNDLLGHLANTDVRPEKEIEHILRITLDEDYFIHKEFFENIGKIITPDADIVITIQKVSIDTIKDLAKTHGFKISNIFNTPDSQYTNIVTFNLD